MAAGDAVEEVVSLVAGPLDELLQENSRQHPTAQGRSFCMAKHLSLEKKRYL